MLSCANSPGKGSDTSSAEGVPPISRKVGIQSARADHPNNTNAHAKHRFECGEWFFSVKDLFGGRAAGKHCWRHTGHWFTGDELTL